MQIDKVVSAQIGTALKWIVVGAVIIMIGGQFYPGYMLDSNAKIEATQARQSAIDSSAGLMCAEIYRASPDSEQKLAALRKGQSYAASRDADVSAAAEKVTKLFAGAKISPEPGFGVKSSCADRLFETPIAAAKL